MKSRLTSIVIPALEEEDEEEAEAEEVERSTAVGVMKT